jgi:hypothetical protein
MIHVLHPFQRFVAVSGAAQPDWHRLSKERDTPKLLETILIAAKSLLNADGGTLYRME